jgi:signal transduction histidine kinase/ligand-binding sensor domain-containing protein
MALWLALLAFVAFADRAVAIELPPLTGYSVASWSGGDGVTLGAIRAMAQDKAGYLWLGTDSGLYRFDGVHFVSADSVTLAALPRLPVRALFVDTSQRLWIGYSDGGGLYVLDGDRLQHPRQQGGVIASVNWIMQDHDGVLWAAHDGGVSRLLNGAWTSMSPSSGLTADPAYHIRSNGDRIYVATAVGLFERRGDGRPFVRNPSAGHGLIRASMIDAAGQNWVTNPITGFQPVPQAHIGEPALDGRGYRLLADRSGVLWVATVGQGLWQIGSEGIRGRLTLQNGLRSDGIWSLLEDREGNIWVGTHEGLNRLTRHVVTPLVDLGITAAVARGTDNTIWASSSEGLIRFTVDHGKAPSRTTFPFQGLRPLHAAASGDVWTASASGFYRFTAGRFTEVRSPSSAPFSQVTAVTSDRTGTVWFADARQGLWRSDLGRLSRVQLEQLADGRINLLRATGDGTLWIASESGVLISRRPDGATALYTKKQGLLHDKVLGIWDDPDIGLWVVGSGGLSRLVGPRFVTIDKAHGLPARRITGIAGDTTGGLWLAFTNGIARLDYREFDRAAHSPGTRIRLRIVDTSEGLAGVPTSLDANTATRGADGRLWFVTGRGMTLLDPVRAANRSRSTGPVRVESVVVDGTRLPAGESVRLAPGTNRVQFDYTAPNLTASDRLSFRYQLEGFDQTWQEAGTTRQAFYTNLEPGDYRFRVQVGSEDFGWQDDSAAWSFSVAPMFYQRPGFYAVGALALAGLLGAAWRVRLRAVKTEFSVVLAERARLSRELHDTLLQSMVGIALKVDSIASTSTVATAGLIDVRRDIEDSITEARRTIRNMRSGLHPVAPADLITALEDAGARATAGSRARCRIVVSGAPYRCEPGVEGELLRIAQEALANAVRHGRPSQIVIAVTFSQGTVALRVSDNGHGFEDSITPPSHFGLQTMQERAEHLGGHFSLTTSQQGTEVLATIPVSSFG